MTTPASPGKFGILSKTVAWLATLLWLVSIFLTSVYGYRIFDAYRNFLTGKEGKSRYLIGGAVLVGIILLYQAIQALLKTRNLKSRCLLAIGLLLVLSLFVFRFYQVHNPIEKIHLFQYSILSILLFYTLLKHYDQWPLVPIVLVLSLCFGLLDEFLQGYLPNRTGDIKDIELNIWASSIGLSWIVLTRIHSLKRRAEGRTGPIFLLVMLGVISTLIALFLNCNPDKPFGYLHRDGQLLTFYSRLTIDELHRQDAETAKTRANLIDRQYDLQIKHLSTAMERLQFEGALSSESRNLLEQIYKHFCFRNQLMITGQVDNAYWETKTADFLYAGLLSVTAPPKWDDTVIGRIRKYVDIDKPPAFYASQFIPDCTPQYLLESPNKRMIAHSCIPSASVKAALRGAGDPYTIALGNTWNSTYTEFINTYSSKEAPFLREMRIHLYRRNRHAIEADYSVAWWENVILEKYFGETLQKTRYQWPPGTRERIRKLVPDLGTMKYESPVANHVTYWALPKQIWITWSFLMLIIGWGIFRYSRPNSN